MWSNYEFVSMPRSSKIILLEIWLVIGLISLITYNVIDFMIDNVLFNI